jgi:hypothetical protein
MKTRLVAASLLAALCLAPLQSRADDLSARAGQVKALLQSTWLPAWAAKSPANESATDAAFLLQTLSHAHRLGYSSGQLDLLGAARVHYKLLRDSRRDKTHDGFFFSVDERDRPVKYTMIQAQVVSALVEYARASKESEPRGLAIKTWRLLRDRARDKTNGGYFDAFVSGTLGPTQASGSAEKSAVPHLTLLEAGTALFEFTRDRSIRRDLEELLDLNQGRFFPARTEDGALQFTGDWKPRLRPTDNSDLLALFLSTQLEAGSAIARAQNALGLPVGWVDFARRADAPGQTQDPVFVGRALDSLSLLARNVGRERRAAQIDEVLDTLNSQTPTARTGPALLDFAAAVDTPTR